MVIVLMEDFIIFLTGLLAGTVFMNTIMRGTYNVYGCGCTSLRVTAQKFTTIVFRTIHKRPAAGSICQG